MPEIQTWTIQLYVPVNTGLIISSALFTFILMRLIQFIRG